MAEDAWGKFTERRDRVDEVRERLRASVEGTLDGSYDHVMVSVEDVEVLLEETRR